LGGCSGALTTSAAASLIRDYRRASIDSGLASRRARRFALLGFFGSPRLRLQLAGFALLGFFGSPRLRLQLALPLAGAVRLEQRGCSSHCLPRGLR
jgi:hypothetical protein